MAVVDRVVVDGDVLVPHAGTGLAQIGHFIAHEDALGPAAVAHIQHVVGDVDVGRGHLGAGSPELDHVGVIARAVRGAEIMDLVAGDADILHCREVHPF